MSLLILVHLSRECTVLVEDRSSKCELGLIIHPEVFHPSQAQLGGLRHAFGRFVQAPAKERVAHDVRAAIAAAAH